MPIPILLQHFERIKNIPDYFTRMLTLNYFLKANFPHLPEWLQARDAYYNFETRGRIN